jgi:subtilisin family serine protease
LGGSSLRTGPNRSVDRIIGKISDNRGARPVIANGNARSGMDCSQRTWSRESPARPSRTHLQMRQDSVPPNTRFNASPIGSPSARSEVMRTPATVCSAAQCIPRDHTATSTAIHLETARINKKGRCQRPTPSGNTSKVHPPTSIAATEPARPPFCKDENGLCGALCSHGPSLGPTIMSAPCSVMQPRIHRFLSLLLLLLLQPIHAATDCFEPRSTRYDGTHDARHTFPHRPAYDATVAMTVEAWVFREDASRCETVISHDPTRSWWLGFCPRLRFHRGSQGWADADVEVPAKEWTHIAATHDGKTVSFFINGKPAGNKPLNHTGTGIDAPLTLGADHGGRPFLGLIDEVRLWSAERSQTEVESGLFLELRNHPDLVAVWNTGGPLEILSGSPSISGKGATPQSEGILPTIPDLPRPHHPILLPGTPPPAGSSISGRVVGDTAPVANVFLALEGPVRRVTWTDTDGHYAFSCLPDGDYRIVPFLQGIDVLPAIVDVPKLATDRTIDFTSKKSQTPKPLVASEKPSGTRIELDRRIYPIDTGARVTLTLGYDSEAIELHALVASTGTADVEALLLKRDPARPRVYRSQALLGFTTDPATLHDGVLSVMPGDRIGVLYHSTQDTQLPESDEQIVGDYALIRDPGFPGSPVQVEPGVAVSSDELDPPPGGKPLGTLIARGGWPVQIPINEIIFFPNHSDDLQRLLTVTGGKVKAVQGDPAAGEAPFYLIQWSPPKSDPIALRQLRDLLDQKDEVFASNHEVLDLWNGILELRLLGFNVASNPHLQLHDVPGGLPTEMGTDDARSRTMLNDGPLNVPQLWAFLALWDRDEVRIPAAILDIGFAPSPDLRTPLVECDMEADGPGGMACGPGRAFGFQRVGNSLFGNRTWHGTGVASTLGGRLNNRWTPSDGETGGRAGVGGQVVQPMLYQYGLGSYVFEFGAGIRKAALDGASVINLSGGYPCRIADNLGIGFNICSTSGRARLCATATGALAAVSATICASAAASAAIPFVGPIIAAPLFIMCGAATTATVAASATCFATLIAGDPRDPMTEGVRFATDRGVPIVASAGNRLSADVLPPLIRELINFNEIRIEQWQVFPAMIEPCIVVGATEDKWPFANQHFTGNRVNVWAPIRTAYYRPAPVDSITPPHLWVREFIGGTSAAAPYVAGTIAAIQAVNPALNPRNPSLTTAQRRSIPTRLRDLLANSSWTTAELVAMAPTNHVDAVNTGANHRRHLINPFRAVQTAALGIVPDVVAMGYDTRLNFNEIHPAEAADTPEHARPLVPGSTQTATIINILGEEGAPDRPDLDWWQFTVPPGAELGIGRIVLTFPRGHGNLTIRELNQFRTRHRGAETSVTFDSDAVFPGTVIRFAVRGVGRDDNVYKITLEGFRSGGAIPLADRFDRNDLANPVRPSNDIRDRAVPIGNDLFPWGHPTSAGPENEQEILINDLNFHSPTDVDWFQIDSIPELAGCKPGLEIQMDRGVRCAVWGRTRRSNFEQIARSSSASLVIPAGLLPAPPIHVVFDNADTTRPIPYKARFIYRTTSPEICRAAEVAQSRGAHIVRELFGNERFPFPGLAPDSRAINPGDFLDLPGRDIDPFDRVVNPEWNLFEWRGGDFTARIELPAKASLRARLLQLDGTPLSEIRTPDLQATMTSPPDNFEGNRTLVLNRPSLPPGTYIIEFSHGTFGVLIGLQLPRNAVRNGSPRLEDIDAGILPTPPNLPPPSITGATTPSMRLEWPAADQLHQLEQANFLHADATWSKAEVPVRYHNGHLHVDLPTGEAEQRFYRLRADPHACLDASAFDTGPQPNPWSIGGYEIVASLLGASPAPNVLVRSQNGVVGLDVAPVLAITLPAPTRGVDLEWISKSGGIAFTAYDAAGTPVATEIFEGLAQEPRKEPRTVALRSVRADIVAVEIHSPNPETVITGICPRYSDLLAAGNLADSCHDLRLATPGAVPNPLLIDDLRITSRIRIGSTLAPAKDTQVEPANDTFGYRVDERVDIEPSEPCTAIHLHLFTRPEGAVITLYNPGGEPVETRRILGVASTVQSVRLTALMGGMGRITITSTNGPLHLLRICCEKRFSDPLQPDCVGFPSQPGTRPNPWRIGGLDIQRRNKDGTTAPAIFIARHDGGYGLDLAGGETTIALPLPVDELRLRIGHEGGPVDIEAQDASFKTIARVQLPASTSTVAQPVLRGPGIVRVIIKTPHASGVLLHVCR